MINYAHRGASAYAPENTMASFRLGFAMGANGVETDVQRTSDGVLMLTHDDSLLRTTGVDKRLCELTYAEAMALDAGSWKDEKFAGEKLVRLEDFLREFAPLPVHFAIELKQPGTEQETVAMLRRFLREDQYTVTSFHEESIRLLAAEKDHPRLGLLARDCSEVLLDSLARDGIAEYCPDARWVTAEMVAAARARGLGVRAWGVKDETLMHRMIALRMDGMTVNFPDKLAEALR